MKTSHPKNGTNLGGKVITSIILSKENLEAKMIPSLSQSEKSFHMIAAREFGMAYYTFKNLDKDPEF